MKFYRYTIRIVAGIDEETYTGAWSRTELDLSTYKLFRETPKGYWIGCEWDVKPFKWVSKTSRKRFAYPTTAEALTNFIARTKCSIEIYEARIEAARQALWIAERKQTQDSVPLRLSPERAVTAQT